jgi:hypothetical protein
VDNCDWTECRPAGAEEVRAATGFAIGGVPPFGHGLPVVSILDEKGNPNNVEQVVRWRGNIPRVSAAALSGGPLRMRDARCGRS